MTKRNVVKNRASDQAAKKTERARWFAGGLVFGLTMLSIAMGSVPTGRVTDDTALYQSLSEIRVAKQQDLNFDGDIARLSSLEDRYREDLPKLSDVRRRKQAEQDRYRQRQVRNKTVSSRVKAPMQRIAAQKYRYSGASLSSSSSSRASVSSSGGGGKRP